MIMKRTSSPFARRKQVGVWIGERVRVLRSACKDAQGLEGLVLDETKHTLVLETPVGRKRVPKKNTLFFFPESGETIDGSLHLRQPEDKLKRYSETQK